VGLTETGLSWTAALLLAADEDVLAGRLARAAGLLSVRALAVRRHGMLVTNRRPSLSSSVGVIASVLGAASNVWAPAQLCALAGLTELDELTFATTYLADGAPAVLVKEANLATWQLDCHVLAIARKNRGRGAGGSRHLAPVSWVQLHIVDHCADGDLVQRHGIADEDRGVRRGNDLLPNEETQGMQDVATLAILVLDEANARIAVGIVLHGLNHAEHAPLGSAEIDDTVLPGVALVSA